MHKKYLKTETTQLKTQLKEMGRGICCLFELMGVIICNPSDKFQIPLFMSFNEKS